MGPGSEGPEDVGRRRRLFAPRPNRGMLTDWGRRERLLCPLDPLEEDHLEGVVVEDVEKEEEEEASPEEALQERPCWSMELAKLELSCCWAHLSSVAATAVAADEAAAAAAAACCCVFDELLAQAVWF